MRREMQLRQLMLRLLLRLPTAPPRRRWRMSWLR
jgi:hypothetical protein